MSYYFAADLNQDFDSAIETVTAALKDEGFGIISEIDIKDKLKEKLDVDFRRYRILGACNPPYAHKALTIEDKIGTMLPCNVIVQEKDGGGTEVAAINPLESMKAVNNPDLLALAQEVTDRLKKVIEKLKSA
ncbi:MAG TPA: hypothetical protein DEA96_00325 [Leptospiraceae bacterium]|nr:hypothetical protein [Spirochaetaceae bacterium]HBS03377.1 hypothetical protein [Leptospiraceae bacterium]|tara:strand:+ start:81 stop:476 length:396 start_codon:yes stop_codon:yes gene_type:complete